MKKPMLFSFWCACGAASVAQSPVTNQRLFDTIPFVRHHYERKVPEFEKEPVVPGRILFLGNSITEGGPWAELIGDKTIVNRGIGGDITFGVLQRLDDVIRRQPSKLFLLIGINDIAKDIPDAVIADNVRRIIRRVKQGSPQTIIYLQSILPVNPGVRDFPQHYDKEQHIVTTNELLRSVARATGVVFVNLYPLFINADDRLHEQYTGDGLHLNRLGYERWAGYLQERGYL